MHGIISITIQPQKITITIIHKCVIEEKNPSTEYKPLRELTVENDPLEEIFSVHLTYKTSKLRSKEYTQAL